MATRNDFYEEVSNLGPTASAVAPIISQPVAPLMQGMTNLTPSNNNINNSGNNNNISGSNGNSTTNDRQHSIRFSLPTSVASSTATTTATVYPIQHHPPPSHQQQKFEPNLNLKQNITGNLLESSGLYQQHNGETGQYLPYSSCMSFNNSNNNIAEDTSNPLLSGCHQQQQQQALNSNVYSQQSHLQSLVNYSNNNTNSNNCNTTNNNLNCVLSDSGLDSLSSDVLSQSLGSSNGLLSPQLNQLVGHSLQSDLSDYNNGGGKTYPCSSPSNSSSSPFYYQQQQQQQPTQLFSTPNTNQQKVQNLSNSITHNNNYQPNILNSNNSNSVMCSNNGFSANYNNSSGNKIGYNTSNMNNMTSSEMESPVHQRSYIDLTNSTSKQPTTNNSYYYPHQQQLPLTNHSQKVSKRTSYEEPEIVSNAGGSYNYPTVQSFPYHHPVAQPGRGPIYNAPNQQMIPSNLEQQKLYPRRGYHQTMYPGDAPKAKPTYGHIPYQYPEHVAQKRVPANYNYLSQPNQSVPPVNPSLRNYSEVHHTGEYDLSKKQVHPSHMGYPPTNPVPSKYPSNSNYFPAQYEDYRQSSKSIAKPQYPPGAQMLPASNAHRGGFNVHANGYYPNLPMNYSHPQVNSYNNSATTYPAGPYPTVPHPYQPSEMAYNHYPQSHPNYPKLPSHQQKPIEEPYPVAKYNRPCYYETTTADKIPYIDLEEQINSSKIPKTRSSSYPQGNIDYHHAQQYPHQFYPQMATSGSGVNNMKYSSMYGKERYRYPPVAQHYPPGLSQGPMHHHHMPPMATGHFNPNHHFHPHLMQHPQFDDGTKKINVREFLSSWNDDEEEAGGAFDPNQMTDYQRYSNYAKSQQIAEKDVIDLAKTQRIQVGISIDKTDLISSSALNLPDIVVDIEKQQQQQQQQKTGSSPVPVNDQNNTAEEKLYVIESIDVPISELNKYKHLSVINKLPENIIHIVNKPPPVSSDEVIILDDCENNFNESELIEKADEQPGPTSAANEEKVSSGVENSMKFIEEIESNSDFKNDFELNVEYDAFAVKKQPETPVKTTDRKESVIVANNIEVKSVKKKHKRKRVKKTSENSDLSDSEQVSKKKFKSLVKCCLDVINTKGYRRNANLYLSSPESEVIIPEPVELKYFRRKCVPVYNPESLRNLCENVLSEMSLIPEVPVAENVEVESEVMEVPKLRDLCEEVLKLNHYIIDMDELCEIGDNEVGQDKADNDSTDNNNNSDNNNHNNGNFCLINLLSDSTDQCAVDFLKAVEDGAEFQVISDDDDDDIQERTAILEDDCLPCDNTDSVENDDCVILDQPTQRDELMDCDYFLEEMNSIQCEEEIIPIDLDRHRRDVLTESLRLKYVNKSSEFRFALSLLRRYQRMTLINRQTRTRLPKSAKLQNRYKVIAYFQRKYGKKVKTIVQQQISEIVDKNNCPKPASNPIVPDTSPADKLTTEQTIINLITPLDNQQSRELTENVTRKAIIEDKSAHKSSYREAIPNQFKDNGRKSVEKRHRLSSTTGLDQETLNGSDNGKRYRRHKSLESRKKWVNRSNSDDTSEKTKSSDSFENDIKSERSGSSKVIKKKTISSKKIKPNFDEMLLNIDSIYKSVSKPKPLKRQKDHLDEIRSSIESSSSSSPLSTTSSSSSSQQSQPENGKRKRKLKFSDYKAMLNTKPKQPPKIRNLDLDKIITKQAVVQLERDGYIDKLGKLYT